MKDNLKLEKVWDQRRREAQEKLATIRRHSPEALSSSFTRNNKELAEEWNQIRHTTSTSQQPADTLLKSARAPQNNQCSREPINFDQMTEWEQNYVQQLIDSKMFPSQHDGCPIEPNKIDQLTEWEQKCVQQLLDSERLCPQKQEIKEVSVRRKWARVRKGFGKPVVPTPPSTAKPVTPPGSGIFIFGSVKKPASNENVFRGTCSPTRQTLITERKNHLSSKDSKGIVSPKKRTTSKKLKRRNKHLMWMLEQKHPNPIRARKSEGARRQPVYETREQPRNKYVLCGSKRPAIQVGRKRRGAYYITSQKGKEEKKKVRYRMNETTPLSNIKWWKIPLAVRQAPSPVVGYARLQSNKRYKPGD